MDFRLDLSDDDPIYSFTGDISDAAGNRMIYNDIDGNMVRCIFSTEECVVRVRYTDLDENALDQLLSGEMKISLNKVKRGTATLAHGRSITAATAAGLSTERTTDT
ncbi:MAG: hypothetical protein D3923_07075 [Candidatus Electrothrix sp. AR3]|nr:hypothetical protein [Candidatus Electrothrix sp. AR3]